MTRSGHIFYFLLTIHLVSLMSQQVWGQQVDNDGNALDFDLATTVTKTNTDTMLILDNNEQQLPYTDLLEQDMDEEEEEEEEESMDDEDDYGTNYDSDDTPMDNYFGPLGQGDSKEQEQGDELGEELLVEYDDDNDTFGNHDSLMFEDDEQPLDFKNDEQMDLDQLLFDASQKDINTNNMEYDYQQHENIDAISNDPIDELLFNANDALVVDPLDETAADAEHPDHSIQEQQQQQQQQQPPNDDGKYDNLLPPSSSSNINNNIGGSPLATKNQLDQNSSTRYKLPLFGILALLVLLYKSQGGRTKWIEKEENELPLHTKDLKIPDIAVDCSHPVESSVSPIGTAQPSPTGHHQFGRRASSSSFFSPRQSSNGGNGTVVSGGGGHARKVSLGHHPAVGSQSKWEDKYRQ